MTDILSEMDPRMVRSIAIVIGFYILRVISGILVRKYVAALRSRFVWRQTINVTLLLVCLPLLIVVWFDEFKSILTMLSLVAAALTIISKELLLNMISYFVIIWRAVFTIGDRVQIGAVSGDVIAQGVMYISIAEIGVWTRGDGFTGRIIKVPNSKVLTENVANYTKGLSLIWEELTFDFSADTPIKKIKGLGRKLVNEHAYQLTEADRMSLSRTPEEIIFAYSEQGVYVSPEENKNRLMLRFPCKFHKRRQIAQAITDKVYEAVEKDKEMNFYRK